MYQKAFLVSQMYLLHSSMETTCTLHSCFRIKLLSISCFDSSIYSKKIIQHHLLLLNAMKLRETYKWNRVRNYAQLYQCYHSHKHHHHLIGFTQIFDRVLHIYIILRNYYNTMTYVLIIIY